MCDAGRPLVSFTPYPDCSNWRAYDWRLRSLHMENGFQLRAKQRPQLLLAMMKTLARIDAQISFEGHLSHTELVKLHEASFDETQVLKRNTTWPKMDFVVLPLTPEMVSAIAKAVVSKVAFKGYAGIIHVQIESEGRLAFSACDNFQDGCVWASPAVPRTLLTELVEKRILHSYAPA